MSASRYPAAPLVTVSIVTHNSAAQLEACLAALAAQTHPPLEVIVTDNASVDDSLAIAARGCPEARLVRNPSNVGFGAAHNAALRSARGEMALLLNPDVRLAPEFVARLVAAMRDDPRVSICCGKLLLHGPNGAGPGPAGPLLDGAGMGMTRARRQYLRGHGQPDRGQFDRPAYVFGACGAAPLYRRSMIEDVSVDGDFFDPDFFMHKEDVDVSWRAQRLGWRCLYVPSAVGWHARAFRPGRRTAAEPSLRVHAVKNRYLTIAKNESAVNFLLHLPWIASYEAAILAYLVLRERSSLAAFPRLVALLPRALARRAAIAARTRASAREIRRLIG